MDRRTPTLEQAIAEGWFKPNELDGKCHCGCGQETKIARATSRAKGSLKGQPQRFVYGHGCDGPMNPNYGKLGAMTGRGGELHPGWKGGRKTSRGYVEVWISANHPMASMRSKAGYVREHRLVVAEHLGRPLTQDEIVHHKNGVKDDNRIENLEIVTREKHQEHHAERARVAEKVLKRLEELGMDGEEFLHVTTNVRTRGEVVGVGACGV